MLAAMEQLEQYKDSVRTTWATGDYDAMMRQEGLYEVGPRLVQGMAVQPGEDVLDVACGTGNATIPAAQTGARVTGLDLTPAMLATARERAAGVAVEWVEGDAEDLPFPRRTASTWCCRPSAACSRPATSSSPTRSPASCGPAAGSACARGHRRGDRGVLPRRRRALPAGSGVRRSAVGLGRRGTTCGSCSRAPASNSTFSREIAEIHHDSPTDAVDCYATQFGPTRPGPPGPGRPLARPPRRPARPLHPLHHHRGPPPSRIPSNQRPQVKAIRVGVRGRGGLSVWSL